MKTNNYTLHMIFGMQTIEAIQDKDYESAVNIIKKGHGEYKKMVFKTATEKTDYIMGLEENNGWNGWEDYAGMEDIIPADYLKTAIQKIEASFPSGLKEQY